MHNEHVLGAEHILQFEIVHAASHDPSDVSTKPVLQVSHCCRLEHAEQPAILEQSISHVSVAETI